MASAGSIYVELLLNDGKYVQGLNRSKQATSQAARSWQNDVNKARDSFVSIVNPVDNVTAAVGRLGGMVAGALSVQKIIDYSDNWKDLQSRLGLVTDSANELSKATDSLFSVAQDNFQPLRATIDAYSRLGISLNDTQKAQVDLIRFTDLLSKTLLVSGANADAAATFFQQFGQAVSSDFKAVGQELQTFADQNPRFYKILIDEAQKYGKTLKKMAEDGELSFEFIANATMNAADQIESDASRIEITVGKALTQLNNALQLYIGQSEAVSAATSWMADSISSFAGFITLLAKDVNIADTALTGLTITLVDFYIKYNQLAKSNAEKFNFFGLNDENVKKYEENIKKAETAIEREGQALLDRKQMIEDYLKEQAKVSETPASGQGAVAIPKPIGLSDKDLKKIHNDLDSLYNKNQTYITGLSKDTLQYNERVAELSQLLNAGKISHDQYNEALTRARNEITGLDSLYEKYKHRIMGVTQEQLRFSDEIGLVKAAFEEGSISAEKYQQLISAIGVEYQENAKQAGVWSFDIEEAGKQASRNIQSAFADFLFDPFDEGLDGMLMSFLNTIKRMEVEALSAQILSGLFGEDGISFGGSAKQAGGGFLSNLFDGFFADGGYIKPGHFGIAGEAGAELIYGGNTGATVIPQGGGGFGGKMTVNIINNAGASVSQSQRQTSNGLELDVLIDQAVAEKIGTPGTKTNRALNAFNSRSLTRR